ncbi:MAG: DNA replication/repair protein RecF [Oscillospiraceae bacterium]
MRIDQLTLSDFRNYDRQTVTFDPRCNIITGENAQGKTNLLEAITYLSCGRSPRARSDGELIAFDRPSARLQGGIFARDRDFAVSIDLYRGKKRKLSVNRVPAKNAAALSDVFHTVFFCPEDLFLIRDGAAARRRFLDGCLTKLRPRYAASLAAYHKLYDSKTRILRDSDDKPALRDTLPEINSQLANHGAVLIHYRAQLSEKLNAYAAIAHRDCSGGREELVLTYQTVNTVETPLTSPIGEIAEQLRAHQAAHAAAEQATRLCLSGPHKDDLAVTIGGRDAKTFSSQGQTRTAALALKLAERQVYQNATGEAPVLLLDDVLSELDPKRQEFVLNRIAGGQVFITCCEEDRLPALLGGRVFHVEQGRIL